MKLNENITTVRLLRLYSFLTFFIFSFTCYAFCCGGGVTPYVPSEYVPGGGQTNSNAAKGQFFLYIENGVSSDMFDVKQLQPLFRNIILSGNERKDRKLINSKAVGEKKPEEEDFSSIIDSTEITDHQESENKSSSQILNLHRLH